MCPPANSQPRKATARTVVRPAGDSGAVGCVTAGLSTSQRLAQLSDFRLERAAEGGEIGAVHDQVAARLRPGDLLLEAEPEVDAGTDAAAARDAEDGADGLVETRVLVLL